MISPFPAARRQSPAPAADPLRFLRLVALSDGPANTVAISPDGSTLAAGFNGGIIRLWGMSAGDPTGRIDQVGGDVGTILFTPDGRRLVVSAGGTTVWDIQSRRSVLTLPPVPQSTIAIAVARDGQTLITGHSDGTVRWWNAGTASAVGSVVTGLGEVIALELSPDGRLLAVANLDTTISLWSVADRTLQRRLTDLVVAPYALDFSYDGGLLAAGGADRIVRCWDTKTWQVVKSLAGQPDPVWAITFAGANRLLIAAGQNSFDPSLPTHLRVWDVAGSKLLQDVLLPAGVSAMTSTPDGRTIVFAGVDPSLRIWYVTPPA